MFDFVLFSESCARRRTLYVSSAYHPDTGDCLCCLMPRIVSHTGPPQDAWDSIAPGAEEMAAEAEAEGSTEERHVDPEDMEAGLSDIVSRPPAPSRHDAVVAKYQSESHKDDMSAAAYNECMRTLNTEQRQCVMYHRQWCKSAVHSLRQGKAVKPYRLFISGPGGVGKSYVIKMIRHDTRRYMKGVREINPHDLTVLLTAPTGVAAHNIGGMTIHSAFLFNEQFAKKRGNATYISLTDDLLNTLRVQLENLLVLIIDEVSMVSPQLLYKLHMRLQDIMRLQHSDSLFGNITIIAVGDLYQLPPTAGSKIFNHLPCNKRNPSDPAVIYGSLWKKHFRFHELTTVVRQADQEFAATLNRVRTGKLTAADEDLLRSRVVTVADPRHFEQALHVYGTNAETDRHNQKMLRTIHTEKYSIECTDTRRDKDTNMVSVCVKGKRRSETGGLEGELVIAEGASVKMVANIDVADGLVNGVRGKVQKILTKAQSDYVDGFWWCLRPPP